MSENCVVVVRVGSKISSWFDVKSRVKRGCVLFPFIRIMLMDFAIWNRAKAIAEQEDDWERKTLLDL